MNWAWAPSLEQLWRSPSFPMWLTLGAAAFFAILVLITLWRAEKSVANGALTVITLLSIGAAAAASIRGIGPGGEAASSERPSAPVTTASLPALACVDDLAGDTVLAACEKVLFASADSTAAAVSYAASRLARLTSFGDLATANRNLTPELESLRRAVERDRYGLMAYVLVARDQCTSAACPAFRSVINSRQIASNMIASNMDERVYEGLVLRYSGSWNAPPPATTAAVPGMLATLPPGPPTGKPTNAEFPSASSTPAVSIMMPEPTANSARAAAPAPAAPPPSARPAAAAPAAPAAAPTAPRKQAPPKAARAPTQLTPPSSPPAPQAPAADNE
jgi:hypothetical protein